MADGGCIYTMGLMANSIHTTYTCEIINRCKVKKKALELSWFALS